MARIRTRPSWVRRVSPARLLRKPAHCAGQASLFEAVVAVLILTVVVWGMTGFLINGRLFVERTGQGVIAAQVADEHIDRTRDLAYASITAGKATETVDGLGYSWVLAVSTAQADPADPNSTFRQVTATLTWPTAPNADAVVGTGIAQ